MRTSAKLLLTALVMALAMASIAAAPASALRSVSISQTRISVLGRLTFASAGFEVVCEVLRTYEFERSSIPKTRGVQVGRVSAVRFLNAEDGRGTIRCTGGNVKLLLRAEDPWLIYYDSILGTLPNITGVWLQLDTRSGGFLVEVFFGVARCLYGGRFKGLAVGNPLREIVVRESPSSIKGELSGASCPEEGRVSGTLFPLTGSENVRLTLL